MALSNPCHGLCRNLTFRQCSGLSTYIHISPFVIVQLMYATSSCITVGGAAQLLRYAIQC